MISQEQARARVTRGAELLDRLRPDWFRQIDVGTLTLHDSCGCVVGQLCGTSIFTEGLKVIGDPDPQMFGFDADVRCYDILTFEQEVAFRIAAFQPLQDAWIEAIAARLVPDNAMEEEVHALVKSAR